MLKIIFRYKLVVYGVDCRCGLVMHSPCRPHLASRYCETFYRRSSENAQKIMRYITLLCLLTQESYIYVSRLEQAGATTCAASEVVWPRHCNPEL